MKTPEELLPDFVREALAAEAEDPSRDRLLAEVLAELGASSPAAAAASGRGRLLDAVSRLPNRYAPFYDKLSELFDLPPEAVLEVLVRSKDPAQWESEMPGVELFHLEGGPATAGADSGFVRVRAGTAFPRHRHAGHERVLILEGAYRDDHGKLFQPGDRSDMAVGTSHSYDVLPGADLVFALVLDEGIERGIEFGPPETAGS